MLDDSLRLRFYFSVFVASLGLGMYTYFIPVFAQSFGATYFDLGLIGTVSALATAITPILAGHLADRTNRVWVFSFSLIVNAIATFVLIFSRSVIDIVVLRLIGGLGLGIFWPMGEALASDFAPQDKRVREMGRYSIAMALGVLAGPSVGGFVAQILGYHNLFIISSAVIGVSLLQSILWVLPAYSKKNQNTPQSQRSVGNMHIVRDILPMYMMLICYGVVWGLLTSIFPGYANSIGINVALIGFLFSAFGMTRIFSLATVHRYLKFGEKRMLVAASSTIFVGILIIAGSPHFVTFLMGIMLIGGGVGVVFPITTNLISRQFPDEKRGAAMGSYETAVNTGETIGPYVAGVIASLMNIISSLMSMSVFVLLMILFIVSWRTNSKQLVNASR
ncbi:MAG: MFS transporter [Candidatus Bathyarchaeia archaeon]